MAVEPARDEPRPTAAEVEGVLARTESAIKRLLWRYRIPPADAEDVLQTAFTALLQRWRRIRAPEAWLISVVRTLCVGWWRRRLRDCIAQVDADVLEALSPPQPPEQQQAADRKLIEQLFAVLPARHRRLLVLVFLRGMTRREAAAATGYELGSITSTIRRALARLRQAERTLRPETIRTASQAIDRGAGMTTGRPAALPQRRLGQSR